MTVLKLARTTSLSIFIRDDRYRQALLRLVFLGCAAGSVIGAVELCSRPSACREVQIDGGRQKGGASLIADAESGQGDDTSMCSDAR